MYCIEVVHVHIAQSPSIILFSLVEPDEAVAFLESAQEKVCCVSWPMGIIEFELGSYDSQLYTRVTTLPPCCVARVRPMCIVC